MMPHTIPDAWTFGRIKKDQIDRYLENGRDFIDDEGIWDRIKKAPGPEPERVREILSKSLRIETLSPDELAILIRVSDSGMLREMQETALKIKKKVYDNRIVTFAPLYMGNYCVNNCAYCGFKHDNLHAQRRVLSMDEIRKETENLAGEIGHKRIIAVYGEHPVTGIDYIIESMITIYAVKAPASPSHLKGNQRGEPTKHGYGNIRRINVNAAPMSIEELKQLHEVGLGTYQVFQETYHHETYAKMHPKGTLKSDYQWRLYAMHRALETAVGQGWVDRVIIAGDWHEDYRTG